MCPTWIRLQFRGWKFTVTNQFMAKSSDENKYTWETKPIRVCLKIGCPIILLLVTIFRRYSGQFEVSPIFKQTHVQSATLLFSGIFAELSWSAARKIPSISNHQPMIYQASPTYFKEFYGFRRYIILTLPSWLSPNSVSHQTDDFPFDINILASLKIGSPKRKVWSLLQHKLAINWGTSPLTTSY